MTDTIDSYRFTGGATKRLVKSWIKLESPRNIPWFPLARPLSDCTVALVSTGGIALKTDVPFDQEGERQNPWWGDPSYRILPKDVKTKDVRVYHLHIDHTLGERDLNCLLPVHRLNELENEGKIGKSAPAHYSFMGYLLNPKEFLEISIPAIIENLRADAVDVVLLIPA